MSNVPSVQDFEDAALDLTTTAQVAMVDYTEDTTTNRNGDVIDTLEGRLKKLGFEPPLPYTAGITFTDAQDAVKSFDEGGIVYGCLASSRPFTTTGNFVADEPNFYVIQDTNGISGNVRNDSSNTYAAGTTQTMPALVVDGVNIANKNNSQDTAILSAADAAASAQSKADSNETAISNLTSVSVSSQSVNISFDGNAGVLETTAIVTGSVKTYTGRFIFSDTGSPALDIKALLILNSGAWGGFSDTNYSCQITPITVNDDKSFGAEINYNSRNNLALTFGCFSGETGTVLSSIIGFSVTMVGT